MAFRHEDEFEPAPVISLDYVWWFSEEESQEQVRRMAAQAAEVDSARLQLQERERALQEVSTQLAAAQQMLEERSEEADRLRSSADEAAAALADLQRSIDSSGSEKDSLIEGLKVLAATCFLLVRTL